MILHVWKRAVEANVGQVLVAAAEIEIAEAVRQHGGDAIVTDPAHPSGSDRIAEALQLRDPEGRFGFVVNLQGDLPTIDPLSVQRCLAGLVNEQADISTIAPASRIRRTSDNPNIVKAIAPLSAEREVAFARDFQRQVGPDQPPPYWHHIGVYAYRRPVLERFVSLPCPNARPAAGSSRCARSTMACGSSWSGSIPCRGRRHARRTRNRPQDAEEDRMTLKVAYQGEPGANSHIACLEVYPDCQPLSCGTFEDAFQAVKDGEAQLAMIPIDNSVAGRVADIHHLLPRSNLYIVGEHFLPCIISSCWRRGADLSTVRTVHSHVHALASAARSCASSTSSRWSPPTRQAPPANCHNRAIPTRAAIATRLAAEIYGLKVVREDIEDEAHNTTRFVILSPTPQDAEQEDQR